jgi:hypothetical protein
MLFPGLIPEADKEIERHFYTVKQVFDLHQLLNCFWCYPYNAGIYIGKIHQSIGQIIMSQDITNTEENVRIPIMQRIIDNPFILLFIGVVFPAVFYIIWGIMEIVSIPIAN